jgi:hypothetical protein
MRERPATGSCERCGRAYALLIPEPGSGSLNLDRIAAQVGWCAECGRFVGRACCVAQRGACSACANAPTVGPGDGEGAPLAELAAARGAIRLLDGLMPHVASVEEMLARTDDEELTAALSAWEDAWLAAGQLHVRIESGKSAAVRHLQAASGAEPDRTRDLEQEFGTVLGWVEGEWHRTIVSLAEAGRRLRARHGAARPAAPAAAPPLAAAPAPSPMSTTPMPTAVPEAVPAPRIVSQAKADRPAPRQPSRRPAATTATTASAPTIAVPVARERRAVPVGRPSTAAAAGEGAPTRASTVASPVGSRATPRGAAPSTHGPPAQRPAERDTPPRGDADKAPPPAVHAEPSKVLRVTIRPAVHSAAAPPVESPVGRRQEGEAEADAVRRPASRRRRANGAAALLLLTLVVAVLLVGAVAATWGGSFLGGGPSARDDGRDAAARVPAAAGGPSTTPTDGAPSVDAAASSQIAIRPALSLDFDRHPVGPIASPDLPLVGTRGTVEVVPLPSAFDRSVRFNGPSAGACFDAGSIVPDGRLLVDLMLDGSSEVALTVRVPPTPDAGAVELTVRLREAGGVPAGGWHRLRIALAADHDRVTVASLDGGSALEATVTDGSVVALPEGGVCLALSFDEAGASALVDNLRLVP